MLTMSATPTHSYPFTEPHPTHSTPLAPSIAAPASSHPFYASHPPATYTGVTKRRKRKPFLTRLTNRVLLTCSLFLDLLPAVCDLTLRALGPLLVGLQWCIFLSMHYLYYYHVVPTLRYDPYSLPYSLVTVVGYALYFTIMYHHCCAVFTQPGRLPADAVVPANIEAVLEAERYTYRKGVTFTAHCRTCLRKKPPRTHHCHVCRQCVLRFDHHCPWIANCVGYYNYRHFYLYMLYLWLGCAYIIALVVPCLLHVRPDSKGVQRVRVDMNDSTLFFALVVATGGWCGLTGMLTIHSWLVATGQTTIEMYVNGKRAEERKQRVSSGSGSGDKKALSEAGW